MTKTQAKASIDSRDTSTRDSPRYFTSSSSTSYVSTQDQLALRKKKSNAIVQAYASNPWILINPRQEKNPLCKHLTSFKLQMYVDLVPDYVMGESACALFISIRYHHLHPTYILKRMTEIGNEYKTRILLCYIDTQDNEQALEVLNLAAYQSDFVLIAAWSYEEAARYIETFKSYEKKSATIIQEIVQQEYMPQVNDVLTTIRSVNKTDAATLASTFSSVQGIFTASMEALALCPGLGQVKVQNLYQTFHEPFRSYQDTTLSEEGPPEKRTKHQEASMDDKCSDSTEH